ncbi:porin [Burkholderia sp. USMB20]|uniref:porin n=1 Tax=Burkholderia sp. USMB20 TaxID=1571773 RepID=UPI0005CF0E3F|nr:porin [Burkholderia sp. USMB20]TGN95698.1 porin [Burkholderia sp. USMB20]
MTKLKYLLVAVLCVSGCGAQAQNVQLYGVLDTGVEYLTNVGPNGASLTRMPTLTGGLPSRWGLRGTEDLGGGLKAIFTLENGFSLPAGTLAQSGREFGRQAFVGLSSNWGMITLGRQQNMTFYSMLDADVIGPAVFSMVDFDPYIANARTDNTISYRGTFSGLTIGATYSLGRDALAPGNCSGQVPGDPVACRAWTAMLKYDASAWGTAVVYDEQRGGSSGATMTVVPGRPGVPFSHSGDKDKRYIVDGYVKVGGVKLSGGWVGRRISAQAASLSTNLYFGGASYVFTPTFSVDAQYVAFRNKSQNADGNLVVLRGSYNLSKSTVLYAMVAHMSNKGTGTYSVSDSSITPASPPAGQGQTGVAVGMRHGF